MSAYSMTCLRCGGPLSDDGGACPVCGPTKERSALEGLSTTRTSAHIDSPEGGAVLAGSPDRLGVFQAEGHSRNWFARITTLGVTALFLAVVAILFLVALGGIIAGFALLGHGLGGVVVGLFVIGGFGIVALLIVVGFSLVANEKKNSSQPSTTKQ